MAMTLSEIRAKLKAQEDRKGGGSSQGGDNAIYPHWNIAEGSTSRIRFLPDANPKNDYFWVERNMIRLPFAGIKGEADSKPVIVQVPCMEMYGKETPCPILAEVRPWFATKDPDMEALGRKYWKKKSYLFQGFVHENALSNDKTPANPIRRFVISPQLINIILAALKDPDLENLPTDYQAGLDFNIKKTSKGGYADYSTSNWSRKESALTAEEMAAIDEHGLFNLGDFLPKKPGEVELKVIKEMFEASVDGQPYDPDRWANYYKPAGYKGDGNGAESHDDEGTKAAPVRTAAPAPAPVAESAPFDTDEDEGTSSASAPVQAPAAKPAASSQKAEDILAMIRNRQNKQ
jgi:hypothetical protein